MKVCRIHKSPKMPLGGNRCYWAHMLAKYQKQRPQHCVFGGEVVT